LNPIPVRRLVPPLSSETPPHPACVKLQLPGLLLDPLPVPRVTSSESRMRARTVGKNDVNPR